VARIVANLEPPIRVPLSFDIIRSVASLDVISGGSTIEIIDQPPLPSAFDITSGGSTIDIKQTLSSLDIED
jgi:hypothetical protein